VRTPTFSVEVITVPVSDVDRALQFYVDQVGFDVRGSGEPVVFIHGAILSDGFVPVIEQTGIAESFRSSITGAAATPVAHALWRA
jgi:catechol 2,3-dioxygenase-like lactoylglutathione lyase family enzyme